MNVGTEQLTLSDNAVDLHIGVEKWLVREYGMFSVAQMADGHLLMVESAIGFCEVFEYEDFEDFTEGDTVANVSCEPPHSLIRAVAQKLGITHVTWNGKNIPVETYFRSDEFDVLRDVEYQPQ